MVNKTQYTGWDIGTDGVGGTSMWYIIDGYTYPFLRSEYSTTILTPHQLQLMAMDPTASYTLAANLDMGTYVMAPVVDFMPVGSSSGNAFIGTLSGSDYTISNLTITAPPSDPNGLFTAVGLFGYTGSGAKIHDVILNNATITGGAASQYVGTLVDDNVGSIYNTSGNGTVSGSGGGLVGYNSGSIATSYSTSAVSGSGTLGGLVGDNATSGSITNSYFDLTGTVKGSGTLGGLVGANSGTIATSYSAGQLIGNSVANTVGGLAGNNTGTITASLWDTYWKVTDGAAYKSLGTGDGSGVTILLHADMGDTANAAYTDWNFSDTWKSYGGEPLLAWAADLSTLINSADQLYALLSSSSLYGTYILTNNIDLSGYTWMGIGTDSASFTGTFIGNNYTISGLTSSNSGSLAGLFGKTSNAQISGIKLTDVNITSTADAAYVGSLVGYSSGGQIADSTASGAVTATGAGAYVGGLVGYSDGTAIKNSSVNSSFSGTMSTVTASGAGSLVGYNTGTITDSQSSAVVHGAVDNTSAAYGYIGGLTGYNAGTISDSTNSGTMTADGAYSYVGGLVGYDSGSISDSSSNSGAVTANGASSYVGGLAGYNSGTISDSGNNGAVTAGGTYSYVDGVAGQNASKQYHQCLQRRQGLGPGHRQRQQSRRPGRPEQRHYQQIVHQYRGDA
jgi:hypothetical protein